MPKAVPNSNDELPIADDIVASNEGACDEPKPVDLTQYVLAPTDWTDCWVPCVVEHRRALRRI
jgi:hypothetical protein